MLRTILVPLDGSTFGEHALPLALDVARRAAARLELAHVCVVPAPLFTEPRPNMESPLDARALARSRAYLDRVVQRIGTTAGVPVAATLLEGGVADALEAHANSREVDLVVMTTHGRGPLSRLWLGSVADQLLRRLPMPLLLMRPGDAEPHFDRPRVMRHMLIPLDGSPDAEQVLGPALELGGLVDADYTLLHVVEPLLFAGDDFAGFQAQAVDGLLFERLKEEARAYLEGMAQRLRARVPRVQTRLVVHSQPAGAILDEARAPAIDLIALATHGRGGLVRMLVGSTADKVVRGASIPVLVYRPRGEA
jgi:nucleotide-binding universal stress UspA family protein